MAEEKQKEVTMEEHDRMPTQRMASGSNAAPSADQHQGWQWPQYQGWNEHYRNWQESDWTRGSLGEIGFAAKQQIETLTSNMFKMKGPCYK